MRKAVIVILLLGISFVTWSQNVVVTTNDSTNVFKLFEQERIELAGLSLAFTEKSLKDIIKCQKFYTKTVKKTLRVKIKHPDVVVMWTDLLKLNSLLEETRTKLNDVKYVDLPLLSFGSDDIEKKSYKIRKLLNECEQRYEVNKKLFKLLKTI